MIGLGLLLFVYTMIALYNDTPSINIQVLIEAFERCETKITNISECLTLQR